MKVKVFLERENKTFEVDLPEGSTVLDLIKSLNLTSSRFVAIVNGKVALLKRKLKEGDNVRLIDVVSGG
jgi:sulfur carrier protein ThiS